MGPQAEERQTVPTNHQQWEEARKGSPLQASEGSLQVCERTHWCCLCEHSDSTETGHHHPSPSLPSQMRDRGTERLSDLAKVTQQQRRGCG